MTTLQKTLLGAVLAVAISTIVFKASQVSALRIQIQTLQEQKSEAARQTKQLMRDREIASIDIDDLREEDDRLRRENGKARDAGNAKPRREDQSPAQKSQALALADIENKAQAEENVAREAALAVLGGDSAAFGRLLELAQAEHNNFKTNSLGLDDTVRGELARRTFAPLHSAFQVLEEAASKGSEPALDAIVRNMQIPELQGLATQSLGKLAGLGNDVALGVLLNPEKHGLLLSTTIGALRPAAEAGNERAIDALWKVTQNETQQPLWYMAAESLRNPAASGDPVAIDALVGLTASTNVNVRNAVVSGLRAAASNHNLKASEALRSMGVQ
jgi:hypothetical protein